MSNLLASLPALVALALFGLGVWAVMRDVIRERDASRVATFGRAAQWLRNEAAFLNTALGQPEDWETLVGRAVTLGILEPDGCEGVRCLCPTQGAEAACRPLVALTMPEADLERPSPAARAPASLLVALADRLAPRPLATLRVEVQDQRGRALATIVHTQDPSVHRARAAEAIDQRLLLYLAALVSPLGVLITGQWLAWRARARRHARERDAALAGERLSAEAQRQLTAEVEGLGHEVISPAASIQHWIQIQRERQGRGSTSEALDVLEAYVNRIANAGERMRSALQMKRRLARSIERGVRIELGRFLAQRLEIERTIGGARFELVVPEEPLEIHADLGDLEEMIGNLLDNARRFAGEQPITIRLERECPLVRIRIRNEGPIVPRGMEERIFDPGVSLVPGDEATSHGLGLHRVRMVASAMHGRVVAINDPEPATHGVEFVVELFEAGRTGRP